MGRVATLGISPSKSWRFSWCCRHSHLGYTRQSCRNCIRVACEFAQKPLNGPKLRADSPCPPELRSAPPHTGSPGPFGPGTPEEPEKSPERVPRGRAPKVSKECAPESQEGQKRVSVTLWAHSFGTSGALARGALSGLFSGSSRVPGPKGAGDPGPIATLEPPEHPNNLSDSKVTCGLLVK